MPRSAHGSAEIRKPALRAFGSTVGYRRCPFSGLRCWWVQHGKRRFFDVGLTGHDSVTKTNSLSEVLHVFAAVDEAAAARSTSAQVNNPNVRDADGLLALQNARSLAHDQHAIVERETAWSLMPRVPETRENMPSRVRSGMTMSRAPDGPVAEEDSDPQPPSPVSPALSAHAQAK